MKETASSSSSPSPTQAGKSTGVTSPPSTTPTTKQKKLSDQAKPARKVSASRSASDLPLCLSAFSAGVSEWEPFGGSVDFVGTGIFFPGISLRRDLTFKADDVETDDFPNRLHRIRAAATLEVCTIKLWVASGTEWTPEKLSGGVLLPLPAGLEYDLGKKQFIFQTENPPGA